MAFFIGMTRRLLFIWAILSAPVLYGQDFQKESIVRSPDSSVNQKGPESLIWGKGFRRQWNAAYGLEKIPEGEISVEHYYGFNYLKLSREGTDNHLLAPLYTDSLLRKRNENLYAFKKDIHYGYLPFGYLFFSELVRASEISTYSPRPVYVPDEKLPEHLHGKNIWYLTAYLNGMEDGWSSEDLLSFMESGETVVIDTNALLQIRVLDLVIRNAETYSSVYWIKDKEGKYIPRRKFIPNSFYKPGGLAPTALAVMGLTPPAIGSSNKHPEKWNEQQLPFDFLFLGNITKQEWKEMTGRICEKLLKAFPDSPVYQHELLRDDLFDEVYRDVRARIENAPRELDRYFNILSQYKYIWVKSGDAFTAAAIGAEEWPDHIQNETQELRVIDWDAKSVRSAMVKRNRSNLKWNEHVPDSFRLMQLMAISGFYTKTGVFPVGDINFDDGIIIGAGYEVSRPGFNKLPYKSRHRLYAATSVPGQGLIAGYEGEWKVLPGNAGFRFALSGGVPAFIINFFGFGNETLIDKDKKSGYYNTHRHEAMAGLYLVLNPHKNLKISIGPEAEYQLFPGKKNADYNVAKVLGGRELYTFNKTKYYAGGAFHLILDNREMEVLSRKGSYFSLDVKNMYALNQNSKYYFKLQSEFRQYFPLGKHALLAARIGGGLNSGDFEFFHSQFLSTHTNLRGYRRYRFAGNKMVFANLEYREKIRSFRGNLLSGRWGYMVSADMGRVWIQDEKSEKLHISAGPGLWLSPGNSFMVTGSLFVNREMIVPYVGFKFFF